MKKIKIFFLLLIIVGFLMRLYKLENFNYHFEQADDIYAAKKNWESIKLFNFNELELKGQDAFRYNSQKNKSNQNFETQIYHGVIYQYLLIPAGVISNFNPRFIVLFFSLISITSLFLFYKIISNKYKNHVIQFFLIAVFTFNGWLILYGRWIWTPSSLIFWSVLSIFLIEKSRLNKKYWLLLSLCVGVATQIHISGILLIPSIAIYAYLNRIYPPKSVKYYSAIISLIILPALPLVIYEINNNYVYLNTIKLFLISLQSSSVAINFNNFFQKLIYFYQYLFLLKDYRVTFLNIFLFASTVLICFGVIDKTIQIIRSKKTISNKKRKIVFISSLVLLVLYPILISVYYSTKIIDIAIINNFIVLFPFLLFFLAEVLKLLKSRYTIIIVILFLVSYLIYNLIFIYERIEKANDGLNYSYKEELIKAINNYSSGKNFEINYLNPLEGQHNNSELITIFNTYNLKKPERLNGQSKNFSQYSSISLNNKEVEIIFYIFDKSNRILTFSPETAKLIYDSSHFSLFAKIISP